MSIPGTIDLKTALEGSAENVLIVNKRAGN
jgi:hypothetical protein